MPISAEKTSATLNLIDDKGGVTKSIPLIGATTFRIGRAESNDMPLSYSWVSRQHAMVQIETNGAYNIIDLGSSNGTFVNGKRIYTPVRLRSGDMIKIGRTPLVFLQEDEEITIAVLSEDDPDEKTVAFVNKVTVTVLICDIHGFTHLSEEIGDSRISDLLQIWSPMVSDIVRNHDGIVDKFLGDAVMAMWTEGQDVGRNILQALKTALEISKATGNLNEKIPDLPAKLEIGAAINTGEAVMGNMGVDGQRDFTVVGDSVNVAFRLESLTDTAGGIDLIMGEETAAHLSDVENHFTARKYDIKGKEEEIQTYNCSFAQLKHYLALNE